MTEETFEDLKQKVRWRVERYNDELQLGLKAKEDIRPVLLYIQALRDITKQEGFPHNIVWPIEPIGGIKWQI
jgi:DUF1365 family protein